MSEPEIQHHHARILRRSEVDHAREEQEAGKEHRHLLHRTGDTFLDGNTNAVKH
jgi:hypothetical protein